MTNRIRKSRILAEVHETATGLHQAGVISKRRMPEYDALSNLDMPAIGASISITELKRNPGAVIEAADGEPVAVLVHNKPSAYLVPADTYKRLLERLEDLELAELACSRAKEPRIKVNLDEL